jgi:lysophospholipase L1-like esterase
MNRVAKKMLSAVISFSIIASGAVLPNVVKADTRAGTVVTKYDFGDAVNTADGYTAVSADTAYTDAQGYGLLSLEELSDDKEDTTYYDGMDMNKGQKSVVQNGAKQAVVAAEDDWVATKAPNEENNPLYRYGSEVPVIRFAHKIPSDEYRYYDAKVTLVRHDAAEEAKANLFSERKHLMLMEEAIPEEGLVYEFSGYVLSAHDKNGGTIDDNMVSIVAEGENVGIASIEITMYSESERGPVLWVFGDSTTTDGNSGVPYFNLRTYTGTGSGFARYLKSGIAVSNMGQGGLASASTNSHVARAESHMKAGDFAYYSMGHNENDGAAVMIDIIENGVKDKFTGYYDRITSKGVKILLTSPVERVNKFEGGEYVQGLKSYADAMKEYVAGKVAAGKTDIAFVDLEAETLAWYNELVTTNEHGKGAEEAKYYFYPGDRTHANDAGSSNWARMFFTAADKVTDPTQRAIINELFTHLRSDNGVAGLPPAYKVPDNIIEAGSADSTNPLYTKTYIPPSDPVQYPYTISKVELKEGAQGLVFDKVSLKRNMYSIFEQEGNSFTYGKIVIEIFDKETKQVKKTVVSNDWLDITNDSQSSTLDREIASFPDDITYDYGTEGYKAYVLMVDEQNHEIIYDNDGNPTQLSFVYEADETPDGYPLYSEDFESCAKDPTTGALMVPGYIEKQGDASDPTIETDADNKYFQFMNASTNSNAEANRYIRIFPTALQDDPNTPDVNEKEEAKGLLKISFDLSASAKSRLYLAGDNINGFSKSPFLPTTGAFMKLDFNLENDSGISINESTVAYNQKMTDWVNYRILFNTVTKHMDITITKKDDGTVLYKGEYDNYFHADAEEPFKGFFLVGYTRDGLTCLDNLTVSRLATVDEIGTPTFSLGGNPVADSGIDFSDVLAASSSKTKTVTVNLPEGFRLKDASSSNEEVATVVKSGEDTIDVTNVSFGKAEITVGIEKIVAPYINNYASFNVSSELKLTAQNPDKTIVTEQTPVTIDLAGEASVSGAVKVATVPDGWEFSNFDYHGSTAVTAEVTNPNGPSFTDAKAVVAVYDKNTGVMKSVALSDNLVGMEPNTTGAFDVTFDTNQVTYNSETDNYAVYIWRWDNKSMVPLTDSYLNGQSGIEEQNAPYTISALTFKADGTIDKLALAKDYIASSQLSITGTASGEATITATVSLPDSAFKTTVDIPVLVTDSHDNTNAKLRDLKVTPYVGSAAGEQLISEFDKDTTSYGIYTMGKKYTTIEIAPTYDGPTGTKHEIKLNGSAEGVNGNVVTLNGDFTTPNTITITVTAADGQTTQDYTVVIDNGYIIDEDFGTGTAMPTDWTVNNQNSMTLEVKNTGLPNGTVGSALYASGGSSKNTDRYAEITFPDMPYDNVKHIEFDLYVGYVGPNSYPLLTFGQNQDPNLKDNTDGTKTTALTNSYLALGGGNGVMARENFGYYDYSTDKWVTLLTGVNDGKYSDNPELARRLHVSAEIDCTAHTVHLTITGDGVSVDTTYPVSADLTELNRMTVSRTTVSTSSNYKFDLWLDNILVKHQPQTQSE